LELVYLWVEGYKNIKNQGFNFSPRFEFEYIQEKNELILKKENKDYVSIFPKNINITAIVGENGSGKSNLLEILFGENLFLIKHFCMLIKKDTKYILYSVSIETNESIKKFKEYPVDSNVKHYSFNLGELETLSDNIKDFSTIFYSTSTLVRAIRENSYIQNTHNLALFEDKPYRNFKIQQIQNVVAMIKNNAIFEKLFELPEMIFIQVVNGNINLSIHDSIVKHINNIKNKIDPTTKDKFLSACRILFKNNQTNEPSLIFGKKINDLHENFINYYQKIVEQTNIEFLYFQFDRTLSAGQETYLYQFASFYNVLKKEINNDIVFCVDEGESTMHPNWQKKYINYLYQFLKDNFSDKKIHLIVSTHSPFLLSDLPKENVIFLDRYKKDENINQKEGNCKNVTNETNIETFGANIHTLLSHGFFMKDGLMGEFAKSKINEAIDNLHGKSQSLSQKQIKSIIDSIGEPFLQIKLEQMYKEKFGLDDEIEELQKQQEEINLKIEQLKNQKSKNAKS
jgi:energy-coupling factor transporter ATP-binding protein EcfA2